MERRQPFPPIPLEPAPRRKWRLYGSSFADYLDTFGQVDSERKIITKLEKLQEGKIKDPVIIDLMASKSALKDIQQTYTISPKALLAVGDKPTLWSQISYIRGDLNKDKTWKKIENWLGDRKAHIIMERAYQGLDYIPTTASYQRKAISRMWDMLDPNGGLLILQTPATALLEERHIPIQQWLTQVTEQGIYTRFADLSGSSDNPHHPYGVLLLEKNGHTTKLPDIASLIASK